jgi:hypothetical protein
MQDIKEQKIEAHREHQLQREYPVTKQPAKKAPRPASSKEIEVDEVDLDEDDSEDGNYR